MVYQLARPIAHEQLRQGALGLPALEPPYPALHPEPYPYVQIPPAVTLHGGLRRLAVPVYNAGAEPCDLRVEVAAADWAEWRCSSDVVTPGGAPALIEFTFRPRRLSAGPHHLTFTVRPGRAATHRLTIGVPDAPLPWFTEEVISFAGPWAPILERATVLTNAGPRPLSGRLAPTVPWLTVAPELVDLAPGEAAEITVRCEEDGTWFDETDGAIALQTLFAGTELTRLNVSRKLTADGPRPRFSVAAVAMPPVIPGGTSTAPVVVTNKGNAALQMKGITISPGQSRALEVKIGPPDTLRPGRLQGSITVRTNAVLPAWRTAHLHYDLDVVSAVLESTAFDYGTLRYREAKSCVIRVSRSDYRRSRLRVAIPPELAGVLRQSGDLLYLRNMRPNPVTVDTDLLVFDDALGGAPLGAIRVYGRCLVPRLEVRFPALTLIPGEEATAEIEAVDAGGGLELHRIASDQPWATVIRRHNKLTLHVVTERSDRGTKAATLEFVSNDFVNPVQRHTLQVRLSPTRAMRLHDLIMWLTGPIRRPVMKLWQLIRARR
ncbi:MAG TPA: hypothetical protein VD969_07315 [Symbiobacteriaceae bacterium]|nr:hypothetical protein [Symbiobacteriaceae bacterium]